MPDTQTAVLSGRRLNGACWGVVVRLRLPGLDPANVASQTAALVATL